VAKLLENSVSRIKVPEGKRDILIFDDTLPGFGIRKFASGKASFFVKYQVASQQRKITLGPVVPGVTAEMRRKASDILAKARLGQDVAGEKKAAREKKIATVGDLVRKYLTARKDEITSVYYREADRYLNRYWKPLHAHAIDKVTRRDVVTTLDDIAAEHGKVSADRAKAALSGFFSWSIDKSYLDASPVHRIRKRASNGPRVRVLSEEEIAAVWTACLDDDYGRIVKLLILTGQRKSEIGDLSWGEAELQKRQIDLPSERTKNRLPHIVPLSDEALAILEEIPRRHAREFLFGEGSRGFQGWSGAKKALDARISKAREGRRCFPRGRCTTFAAV
jgi:integrase